MVLGDKIIRLRRQNGWSQEELAEQLGISRQSVSKWESGTSVPDLDKIIKLSGSFRVSTDYLLKEESEEAERSIPPYTEPDTAIQKAERKVSLEEVREYLDLTSGLAGKIAIGVALCILGPAVLLVLLSLSLPNGAVSAIFSEEAATSLGVVLLLLLCAAGVAILITNGMKTGKYEFFEKEELSLEPETKEMIEQQKAEFEPTFRKCITCGVTICILSVVPLLLAGGFGASDQVCLLCTVLLLLLIAAAVYLFVWSGMIHGSYEKALQVGDYTPENKRLSKKTAWFSGTYWCVMVAIYLFISFTYVGWQRSWILWPVAGVLFAALYQIVKNHAQKELEKS